MKNWIMAILILVLLTTGCATEGLTGNVATREPIRIGAAIPLSGTGAIHGQNVQQGIDLAVHEINAMGGINGRTIQVLYEDDKTNSKTSVTVVRKLITVDEVDILFGGVWAFLAEAVIPEVDKYKMIMFSSSLPDTIYRESPYFYSVYSPVSSSQPAVESFLETIEGDRIAIMVMNNLWGYAHASMYRNAIEAAGKELALEIFLPEVDGNDLATEMIKIEHAEADALLVTINFDDSAMLGKKRQELGWTIPILAQDNLLSSVRAGRMGWETADGIVILSFNQPSPTFIERFEAEYNKPPEMFSDIAYDSVYILKHAMEGYGESTEEIQEGIREIWFEGASGTISFGERQYPYNKQPVLQVIRDGNVVPFGIND